MTGAPMTDDDELDPDAYLETMRAVIHGADKSFVVFAHGTVVVFTQPSSDLDLAQAAKDLLAEHGPVHPGSAAGDFGVITLPDGRGWAVTSHHPDILTLMLADEAAPSGSEMTLGLVGRAKRDQDAEALAIVGIEDRRGG